MKTKEVQIIIQMIANLPLDVKVLQTTHSEERVDNEADFP